MNTSSLSLYSNDQKINLNIDKILQDKALVVSTNPKDAFISLDYIKQEITVKNASWTASYNDIFTPEENYVEFLVGCLEEEHEDTTTASVTLSEPLPSSWDWRDVNGTDWVTPIRNQKSCGSCVAFGSLGALEAVVQIELQRHLSVDLSEAHLFFCGGGSCSTGWWVSRAVDFIETKGVPSEKCFPYTPMDMSCESTCPDYESTAIYALDTGKVGGFPPNNVSYVQQALIEYGPLITGFTVYHDFSSYHSGVYEHVTGDIAGGHAVTIVGYSNDWGNETEGYWICKNSWGKNWGEQGFFRIKYGECGIGTSINTYYVSGLYGGICDEYIPAAVSNPYPADKDVNIQSLTTLQWNGGDPNPENTVTYEIYFGENESLTFLGAIGPFPASQTQISFTPPLLKENTCYFWKIIAIDNEGLRREGPVWQFCTIDTLPPEIEITSPQPGFIYKYGGTYRKQIPPLWDTIVIGTISVEVHVDDKGSGIESIDLYLDKRLQHTFTEEDWIWVWQRLSLGRHTIRIIAQDRSGNEITEEMIIWKFL